MKESETERPPDAILISRDLIFTSKITGTASALGYRVQVVGDEAQARLALEKWQPRAVLVDLSGGLVARSEELASLRGMAPEARFLAFGPHVDHQSLAAAREAGCDSVLPRSRFSAELPELIRAHLGPRS